MNSFKILNKKDGKILSKIVLFLILISILFLIIYKYNNGFIKNKYIEKTYNLNFIENPIQITTSLSKTIKIDNTNINLNFIAEYKIIGRVVATTNYNGSIQNKLSPKDVALVWGSLSNKEVDKKIKWSSRKRKVYYSISDTKWLSGIDGKSTITSNFSNNHLIPSNDEIRNLIKSIKKDDYIKIEGYLVNVYWQTNKSRFRWNTSTTRTDTGNGACEIIYVENITWLKNK